MIEIAQETQPVDRTVARAPLSRAKSAEAALQLHSASASTPSTNRRIAELLGALALVVLAILSVLVVRKRREVRGLREQIGAQVAALEAHARRARTLL
jgi:hypothetical protein